MNIRVGTFNLNNLFSRFNLYTEADPQVKSDSDEATVEQPRTWLEHAGAAPGEDIEVLSRGTIGPDGKLRWLRTYKGRLVFGKKEDAQRTLAKRIEELDVDVLAVQEVENLPALEDFVGYLGLRDAGFRHLSLVEGNDDRLIDVGLISKLPLGAVTSWRHWVHPDDTSQPAFSRDLLQVQVLDPGDHHPVLTIYVNHLKSQLAETPEETEQNDKRRRRQATSIARIIADHPPKTPYLVVGDMNDTPDADTLAAIGDSGMFNALAEAEERGGPYPADDPMPPPDSPWTHRYQGHGETRYELYDQIWASPDLKDKLSRAWILRRTLRRGNASDHDPAAIELERLQ